jgi:hypothetical protein
VDKEFDMAGRTTAGTREPGVADSLSPAEAEDILASDEADVSPRADTAVSGKRVRAIPAVITKNGDRGTVVEINKSDFSRHGIEQNTVVFDSLRENFTVPVGSGENCLSSEAADFLTKNYPTSFEYIGG